MIHLITYADKAYENAKKRIINEATNTNWFNTIKGYSPNDLTNEFKDTYNNILCNKRGAGYWIWKYDIINQRLNEIHNNDILIYIDAGCTINKKGEKRFYEYIDMLNDNNPIISFQMPHLEYQYTTKEIFEYFNVLNNDNITNTGQILNGILIMRKNDELLKLINLWGKTLIDNPLLFTDYYNNNQNIGFKDNRHEQSVFSVIRKLHSPILLSDETYFIPFGNKDSLDYPFWATRKRN
jgi:hypothetical protein